MRHEPCRLLRNTKVTGNLTAANPVLTIDDEPERGQPLIEAERRILKDGAGLQGELGLQVVAIALPRAGLVQVNDVRGLTLRTSNLAIGPSQLHHEASAAVEVCEVEDGGLEGLG